MKKLRLLGTLLIFSGFIYQGKAQDVKLPTFISDSLNRYIKRGMANWKIPGLSVAIVKDGKVVLAKGYGMR